VDSPWFDIGVEAETAGHLGVARIALRGLFPADHHWDFLRPDGEAL
jgi:hypothetical protein